MNYKKYGIGEREIKFRCWYNVSKKMVDLKSITPFSLSQGLDQDGLFIPFGKEYINMQYTGKKDKNEKEIYEGDIIKKENYIDGNMYTELFVVVFSGSGFYLRAVEEDENGHIGEFAFSSSLYYQTFKDNDKKILMKEEIIGNIFENSNLIKKQND